jgi:pimeloyl-ACP methyl ester carboxylesterase
MTGSVDRLIVAEGAARREIARIRVAGRAPGLFWLGGFNSDMTGGKAEAVAAHAAQRGLSVTRFDYSGHGASGGRFEEGTISRWLEESLAVFDDTGGRQILIGSSMGGWLALLLARARRASGRVGALVLIAPAADFTEALLWAALPATARRAIEVDGVWPMPSDYGAPIPITRGLIEDGRRHLLLDHELDLGVPVTILQGVQDESVPWRHTIRLVTRLVQDEVTLSLVPDGDHRLSRPQDIARLLRAVDGMVDRFGG